MGVHAAPLIQTNSSGVGGGLFSVNFDYFLLNRLSFGASPYFGFTREQGPYGFDLVTMQPVGTHRVSYNSLGINLELKYFITDSNIVRPYAVLMSGLGRTYFNNYFETESKSNTHEHAGYFNSYNYGVGLGSQIMIAPSLSVDVKFMYSGIVCMDNPISAKFVYPSIGLIKTF